MTTTRRFARRNEQVAKPKGCEHPDDLRIDARSMGHMDRWICGVCGARLGNWEED